jgi:uroporphyrinogen decarboxylase
MSDVFLQHMNLQNNLLLRAAKGEQVERTPVWVMRQAGRVLPEYRATRARAGSFITLVRTPELACEVTLQPVDILGVDAAIIFSDILVIPEAMGLPYEMDEGKGPRFPNTIKTKEDLARLSTTEIEGKLNYVAEALILTKQELNGRVPLIGFAGAPFTLFCYMIEGQGSKEFAKARRMMRENPELAHALLSAISDATIAYLKMQIASGADLIQLFDSWAGVLGPDSYREFSLPYINRILAAIPEVPRTVFAKGAWYAIEDFANSPCETIGLDWTIQPELARKWAGAKTLQGNLDPSVLYGDFASIKKATREMLQKFGTQKHIANLGHGVYPDISPDNLKCFIDTIKEYPNEK